MVNPRKLAFVKDLLKPVAIPSPVRQATHFEESQSVTEKVLCQEVDQSCSEEEIDVADIAGALQSRVSKQSRQSDDLDPEELVNFMSGN